MLTGRLPLILAGIFAALAGLVAFLALHQKSNEISAGWQPVKIVVARRDLQAGEVLSSANLSVGLMPDSLVTKSVVTVADMNQNSIYGLKLAIPMLQGDPLYLSHIHSAVSKQRLADAVQEKGRAVAIRVSPESSVHNWVAPGDRVDVLGSFRDPRTQEMVTVTLFQNVIVLATGRINGQRDTRLINEAEANYSTVTLQVLPEAAEMLVLAQDLGTLYLTLRGPTDTEVQDLGEGKTTIETLLTGERSKRISNTQSKIFKVEIIRGNRTETQTVP